MQIHNYGAVSFDETINRCISDSLLFNSSYIAGFHTDQNDYNDIKRCVFYYSHTIETSGNDTDFNDKKRYVENILQDCDEDVTDILVVTWSNVYCPDVCKLIY